MLAAYWMAHMPQGGLPIQNGGEVPLLFALVWLFLVGNGAGPWSVDAALARRRGGTTTTVR
jgi:putative oxidoreductase